LNLIQRTVEERKKKQDYHELKRRKPTHFPVVVVRAAIPERRRAPSGSAAARRLELPRDRRGRCQRLLPQQVTRERGKREIKGVRGRDYEELLGFWGI